MTMVLILMARESKLTCIKKFPEQMFKGNNWSIKYSNPNMVSAKELERRRKIASKMRIYHRSCKLRPMTAKAKAKRRARPHYVASRATYVAKLRTKKVTRRKRARVATKAMRRPAAPKRRRPTRSIAGAGRKFARLRAQRKKKSMYGSVASLLERKISKSIPIL